MCPIARTNGPFNHTFRSATASSATSSDESAFAERLRWRSCITPHHTTHPIASCHIVPEVEVEELPPPPPRGGCESRRRPLRTRTCRCPSVRPPVPYVRPAGSYARSRRPRPPVSSVARRRSSAVCRVVYFSRRWLARYAPPSSCRPSCSRSFVLHPPPRPTTFLRPLLVFSSRRRRPSSQTSLVVPTSSCVPTSSASSTSAGSHLKI